MVSSGLPLVMGDGDGREKREKALFENVGREKKRLLGVSKFFPKLGLGISRFEQILAFLATRPVTIGFGFFQPPIISENNKTIGYLGRTGMVA
jgi:hypothetical protein